MAWAKTRVPEEGERINALLTAAELAQYLRVDVNYVYQHAERLGALRLPSAGTNGRLRFRLDDVLERLNTCHAGRQSVHHKTPATNGKRFPRQPRGLGTDAPLLPIRANATAERNVNANERLRSPRSS